MDVEFITDHDTEDALLGWCARRRREVVPGTWYLLGAELFIVLDVFVLWRHQSHLSLAFIIAMLFQILAFAVAAIARDPDRPRPPRSPHAELCMLGLLIASLTVTFEHRPSVLAFLLLGVMLTAAAALAARCYHGFPFLRDVVEFQARVVHVHLDAQGMSVQVRPDPARHIPWKSVRYLGADAGSLFVVAGWTPVVVPSRAFASRAAWEQFVAAAGEHAQAALNSSARPPIWRHVRSPKARRTKVVPRPLASRQRARRS
jgi:hypothetical protein